MKTFKSFEGIEIITSNSYYLSAFANNFINGNKLLNIRPYELFELGITKIGHQETIIEAIENLKFFVRIFFANSIYYICMI